MLYPDRKKKVSPFSWADSLRYMPRGWFAVCRSQDVKRGDSKVVLLAEQEILVVRTERSQVRGYYAYCPHQGVRFGSDKKNIVRGTVIHCPFHDFRFDCDTGACVEFYAGKKPKTRNLDLSQISVAERDGWVFAAQGLD